MTTPRGHVLLFQASIPRDSVSASAEELWRAFLPVLAVALVALALVQIPLALRSGETGACVPARAGAPRAAGDRVLGSGATPDRSGDLHDGPIQQLAGLSMSLAANADTVAPTDPAAAPLREAAGATRRSVRVLRSALMGIYPPNVRRAGLGTALIDLSAPLTERGITAEMDVPPDLDLPADVEALLFRASGEAFRNVERHARAGRVRVRVAAEDGVAVLEVEDDGIGFPSGGEGLTRANGHVGLPLLRDLAGDSGGTLVVDSVEGRGTRMRLEVPVG